MDKVAAILQIYPNYFNHVDFEVQDDNDGKGPYISFWHISDPQPTDEQLATAWVSHLKNKKIEELTDAYNACLATPYTSAASGTEISYPATAEAWAEMQKQLLMNANGIAKWPVPWRAADGSIVDLDETQFKQLASDLRDIELAALTRFRSIQDQIKDPATDTPDKIDAILIDFSNLQTTTATPTTTA